MTLVVSKFRLSPVQVHWAHSWKLKLNAGKSEVSFFSTHSKEAKWTPRIEINGE